VQSTREEKVYLCTLLPNGVRERVTSLSLRPFTLSRPWSALVSLSIADVRGPVNVCFQGKTGKHLLEASFSHFDPERK
jgi:hypothetical protein